MRRVGLLVAVLGVGGRVGGAYAAWVAGRDLATNEVSATELSDPNGQVPEWSYGKRPVAASDALMLFVSAEHFNGSGGHPEIQGWSGPSGPTVEVNAGPGTVVTNFGFGDNVPTQPLEIMMHPASDNTYGVARWTAPHAGYYAVRAIWHDIDPHGGNGASGDVVVNGQTSYHGEFDNGGGAIASPLLLLTLSAGAHVDFLTGSRGDWTFDTTGFDATVRLAGDANDDGRIDADDFALTDRGAAMHLNGWSNGDFDGSGAVDGADYSIIDTSYAVQQGLAEAGAVVRAVPEPAGVVAMAGLLAVRRRRCGRLATSGVVAKRSVGSG